MNYPLKSSNFELRKKTARKKNSIIFLILLIIMAVLLTAPVRDLLFSVASPIWKFKMNVLNSNIYEYFKSKQTLINERRSMEQKLFLAGNLMAMNSTLLAENETLKDLLGRREIQTESVLATILVKPPQTPYDIINVDVGSVDNVKPGDKVIANASVYIGEVSEVFPHNSKIVLYSTPGRKLSVVLGANSVTVEAVGIGGGNFNIFLPREIEVKENDVIIIPSITANVFGIVEKVNFKESDSFQTVLFKSPVNVSELGFVEILI